MTSVILVGPRRALRTAVVTGAAAALLGAATTATAEPGRPPVLPVRPCVWTPQLLPKLPGGGPSEILGGDAGGTVWAGEGGATSQHALLWRNGQPVDLGTGAAGAAIAYDVNRSGVAVGEQAVGGFARPVLWRDGQLAQLAVPPGFVGGVASGIDDAGLIVGEIGAPFSEHAAAWAADRPEQVIDLGTAGGDRAMLNGVSESGVFAGVTIARGAETALSGTVSGGLSTLPGTAAGTTTRALAAAGPFVVGAELFSGNGGAQAVVWDAGRPRPLPPRQLFDVAIAVNPAGLVAGVSDQQAVVWSRGRRIPLPATTTGNSTFTTASVVSDDGRVGGGVSPGADGTMNPAIWTCRPTEPRRR